LQPQSASTTVSSATAISGTAISTTALVDYIVAAPDTISTVELDCPGLDGSSYITARDQKFDLHCGDETNGDDVGGSLAYTLFDCIESCSYMNWAWGNATFCNSVLFVADIQRHYREQRSNCWLKNATTIWHSDQKHFVRAQLNTG
jgi:hypothetical protein